MLSYWKQIQQRLAKDERGITALETAIILIAFVVVASVFAFTILSAGTFSTERGKEAIYAGLSDVQSSMEIKGSVIAVASSTGTTGTVDSLIFTISNTVGAEPVDLTTGTGRTMIVDYRDASNRVTDIDWAVTWRGANDGDALLEAGELAEVTVPLTDTTALPGGLGSNTEFVVEVKPPAGAVLSIQRTTPAFIEAVYDLQ